MCGCMARPLKMAVHLPSVHLLLHQALLHAQDCPSLLIIALYLWLSTRLPLPPAGFPGNWWAHLKSMLSITGSRLLLQSSRRCCCVLPAGCRPQWGVAPGCGFRYVRFPHLIICCLSLGSLVSRLGYYKARRTSAYSPTVASPPGAPFQTQGDSKWARAWLFRLRLKCQLCAPGPAKAPPDVPSPLLTVRLIEAPRLSCSHQPFLSSAPTGRSQKPPAKTFWV